MAKPTAAGAGDKPVKAKAAAPAGPKYADLVKEAIMELKERTGSSLAAIKKTVGAKHKVSFDGLSTCPEQSLFRSRTQHWRHVLTLPVVAARICLLGMTRGFHWQSRKWQPRETWCR